MADFIHDEALDALVRELNRKTVEGPQEAREGFEEGDLPLFSVRGEIAEGEPLERLLSRAAAHRATDVLLIPGSPPALRVAGRLHTLDAPPLEEAEIRTSHPEELKSLLCA